MLLCLFIFSAEQILAASKASTAPPPHCQAAGGSFASVDVPVCSRHTKSDTPEASNGSEEQDKMEIENNTQKNETNEGADSDAGSNVVENQKKEEAELDVESEVEIQVKDSKDDGKESCYSLLLIH